MQRATILIVDDNRDAADLLGEALRTFGYTIEVTYSALDAIALVESLQPAAALVDIGLPEMTGYELARALRRRVTDIQLVALTGYGQGADRERALAIGFAEHLVKPALIDDVVATLERLLGNAP